MPLGPRVRARALPARPAVRPPRRIPGELLKNWHSRRIATSPGVASSCGSRHCICCSTPTSFLRKAWNSHAANAADSLAATRSGEPATPATAMAAEPAGPIGHIERMTKVRWAPTTLSTSIIEPAAQVIEV